jgi:hypothetical protein
MELKYGKDKKGVYWKARELKVGIHKGLKCKLFHPLTNEPLEACALNSNERKPYFRVSPSERRGNSNPNTNESLLHKFVKEMFKHLKDETITISRQSIALLGYIGEEQRIKAVVNEKEIQAYTPDILFKGIAIEVIVSSEIKDSKRGFYEGLNYKLITVRYSDEERKNDSMVNKYLAMELDEVLEDIISRCEIQKPIRDVFSEPYNQKVKDLQEQVRKLNGVNVRIKDIERVEKDLRMQGIKNKRLESERNEAAGYFNRALDWLKSNRVDESVRSVWKNVKYSEYFDYNDIEEDSQDVEFPNPNDIKF